MSASSDFGSPEFFRNPYPCYSKLRASGEAYWLAHDTDVNTPGIWLFSRYADALQIFRQPRGVSKEVRNMRKGGGSSPFDLHMLHRDGADHLRLRHLVSDYFSLQSVRALQSVMTEVADGLLKSLAGKEGIDLIADFAEPLPLHVIARLVGVPAEDMERVRAWSLLLGDGFDSLLVSPAVDSQKRRALAEFLDYAGGLIEARRREPDDSLLGVLTVAADNDEISSDKLAAMLCLLLFAGHETTVSLIGNGLWLLLSHPGQWQMLRQDSTLIPGAVEEILRFESPEQRSSFRVLLEPVDIGGRLFAPGEQIGVIIGSANRDEAEFDRPEVFDIRRTPNNHLAFGTGLHNCLGKTMARVEAAVALARLLDYFPRLRLGVAEPGWRVNSFFRGLRTLPAQV